MCQATKNIHSANYSMRYNPDQFVTHAYKLHMEA